MAFRDRINQNAYVFFSHRPHLVERWVRLKWRLGRRMSRARIQLPARLHVTLTSYRARFGVVGTTLRCLLMQTLRPDKLVLWVSEADYPHLPADVQQLKAAGLQIRTCRDLRSYKKIIPALQEDPGAIWVTADDDCYYAPDWLESLVRAWKPNSREIVCQRAHRIRLKDDGSPRPYREWQIELREESAHPLNFFTGIGGVLYPPGCFAAEVLDEALFQRLCPRTDDVWLWWMIRRNGYVVRKTPGRWRQITWEDSQDTSLFQTNVHDSGNDDAIRNLTEHFGFPLPDEMSKAPHPA
jgi:hypothetical protein